MQSITNAVKAASSYVSGEPNTTRGNETGGQEPISGQQGQGTINEPYDQGNSAEANPSTTSDYSTNNTTSSSYNPTTSSNLTGSSNIPTTSSDKPSSMSNNPFTSEDTTGSTTGGNTFGSGDYTSGSTTNYGSDPSGPHDSRLANKVDPRVDSDRPGAEGNTLGAGYGNSSTTGSNTGGYDDTSSGGNTFGTGNTTTGTTGGFGGSSTSGGDTFGSSGYGSGSTSDPSGPHDSRLANKADPRVDSDRPGAEGNSFGAGNTTGGYDSTSRNQSSSYSSNPTNTEGGASFNDADSSARVPNNPVNASQGLSGNSDPLVSTDKTGVTSGRTGHAGSDINPSSSSANPGAAPSSGGVQSQKQQGGDRPEDAPTGEQTGAVKESKEDSEEALLSKRDPNDHSGEPMHMHGGDFEKRRESKVGNPGGQEHGKEPKGTGEQWVKTSGLAADGGDFDATKPGAGREADRLLEEKGIKKSDGGAMVTDSGEPAPRNDTKEKVSLSEKIKDKLHIGGKDK